MTPGATVKPQKGYVAEYYTTYKGRRLGPYYVRHYTVHGKRKKQYIKKENVERVRAACQAHRESKSRGRQIARNLDNIIGNLNWLDRMAKRLDKGAIKPEDHAFVEQIKRHGIATPGRTKLKTKRSFMDLFSQKTIEDFWKQSLKDANRIAAAVFSKETTEDKWKRWRKSLAERPKPRPLPMIDLPDWADKNEIAADIDELLNENALATIEPDGLKESAPSNKPSASQPTRGGMDESDGPRTGSAVVKKPAPSGANGPAPAPARVSHAATAVTETQMITTAPYPACEFHSPNRERPFSEELRRLREQKEDYLRGDH